MTRRDGKQGYLRSLWVVMLTALFGCTGDADDTLRHVGPGEPRDLTLRYSWVLEHWEQGEPRGYPQVEVEWALSSSWGGEPFRVYARASGQDRYRLIATVTSCSEGRCLYADRNVLPGERYDYYVAAVDERSEDEVASGVRSISVPRFRAPAEPGRPQVTALDGALFLQWETTGAERYMVLVEPTGSGDVFVIGETDGSSFLDDRAANGEEYLYRVASVDTLGHVGRLSGAGAGIPRPDYHAELIYAHPDQPGSSGFRFVAEPDAESPIFPGDDSAAQWRLDVIDGELHIVPRGETRVTTRGIFTTSLACGPGSESDCESIDSVDELPSDVQFSSQSVPADAGSTYVFEVRAADGRRHFAKIRIQGVTTDSEGRRVAIFDWAYQLRADEPSLMRLPG